MRRILNLGTTMLLIAGAVSGCAIAGAADDVVRVMTWAPQGGGAGDHDGMPALAEAIGKQIADRGGLNGHPFEVLTCDEHNTPSGAIACANQAVQDHVVAVIGSYSQYAGVFLPTLQAAGIPYIGGYGVTSDEFTAPYSYPVNGGTPALLAGAGVQLAQAGCTRVAVVRPDSAAGDSMTVYLNAGLATAGSTVTAVDVPTKAGQTDYTQQAQEAIGRDRPHECVITGLDAASTVTFYDSYRRLEPQHTQLAAVIGSFQQSLVDATGGRGGPLEGALATGWYPPDSSLVWNGLHDLVKQYAFTDNRIDVADPDVETTWIAYQAFLSVVDRLGTGTAITARAVRVAFDETGPVSTGGATPPLSWQRGNLLASADIPRAVNSQVSFQVVRNGALAEQSHGFTDIRPALLRANR